MNLKLYFLLQFMLLISTFLLVGSCDLHQDVCISRPCPLRKRICERFNDDSCENPDCNLLHICILCHGDHRVTSRFHEDRLQNLYCVDFNNNNCKLPICRNRHVCLACEGYHPALHGTQCRLILRNRIKRSHICEQFNEETCLRKNCPLLHICFSCFGKHTHRSHRWDSPTTPCALYNETNCNYAYCRLRHVCYICRHTHRVIDKPSCKHEYLHTPTF